MTLNSERLQDRLNRRLQKLAKWADHPIESRWKDVKPPLPRPNNYGKGTSKYSSVNTSRPGVKPLSAPKVAPKT